MKRNSVLIFILLAIFGIVSCNSSKKLTSTKEIQVADNSMTSVDWAGTYFGILPCADCEGIKTQIVLKKDLTYSQKTQYLGKSDSIFEEKGKFEWNKTGSTIKLDNSNQQNYQIGENLLFHLDKNGKRIIGDLANNYKMIKMDDKITGKYWKLVRLKGHTINLATSEPFIKLNVDNSVNGNSTCNSFNGKYELMDVNKIRFTPFAMTKMACIGNDIENEFMQVIEKTTGYSVSSNELILQDEFETSLAIFVSDYFK